MGHLFAQAAQLIQVRGARFMEHGTGCKEQKAFEECVVKSMIDTGREADCREQTHSRKHISDLGDRVEGKQTLEVMLGKGHGNAKEHGHTADEHQQELEGAEPHGLEEEVGQTDDAVDTALRQNTGNQDGDGSGSCTVSVGSQRVERHNKGLGAETDKQKCKSNLGRGVHIAGNNR